MIRYRFPLLIATWVTCFGFFSSNIYSLKPELVLASSLQTEGKVSQNTFIQAQATEEEEKEAKPELLQLGDKGEEVKNLQNQLQELGYLETEPDGEYNLKTKQAVAKFQDGQGLKDDGVAGGITQKLIGEAIAEKKTGDKKDAQPEKSPPPSRFSRKSLLTIVAALAILGALAGGVLMLLRFKKASQEDWEEETDEESEEFLSQENHELPSSNGNAENHSIPNPAPQKALQVRTSSPLAKVDRIEELIKDLQESDRIKRRQAIWELAQKGDSRAVKPLSNLIIDSDSQQCSLILEALSQISIRTLKPVNRALAMSLQDDNPEVRKNAIRDLTKVYDMVNQVNRLLQMACDDPDPEVQETAKWAAEKFGKLPMMSGNVDLPQFSDSLNALERRLEE
ncbi:MAG: peptidoglycan-binding protein [Spirulinaceae cyanobacterium]